jgi:hypothetical protein
MVLADVYSGRTPTMDVCDANPYLLRAAKFHGEETRTTCPVCRRESLTHVHWVYGDLLKHASGSARKLSELTKMSGLFSEFTVYVVEVCRTCHWNHLVQSYVLGTASGIDTGKPAGKSRSATAGQ